MARRIKIGDIIEIKTKKGLFYAQYTHYDEEYGELIQVKKHIYSKRPKNISQIVQDENRIIAFIPLSFAVNSTDIFMVIGNMPIPDKYKPFPVFKCAGYVDRKGVVKQWKFWDGDNTWPDYWVNELSEDEISFPRAGIWTYPLLVDRLESDWTEEKHCLDMMKR